MNRACASEFDYAGWISVGRARRKERGGGASAHNCWVQCDYPSECRWGKEMNPAYDADEDAVRTPLGGAGSFEEAFGLVGGCHDGCAMDADEGSGSSGESAKSGWSSSSSSSASSASTTSLTAEPGVPSACPGASVNASPLHYAREYDEQGERGSKRQSFLGAVSAVGKKRVGGLLGLGMGLGFG